jgi:AcrR family transcriptional regulator
MATEYSGSGDPVRTLALLWREPGRAGRAGLNVDRVVAAAIEVADAEGLGALTMRRVAQQLSVGTMSLYTHVAGKAELIDVMLDTVYGEVTAGDESGGWRERLERIARDLEGLYHRHAWLLHVATTRPALGPNLIAKYERELRAVEGIGLSDIEMDAVVTLINGYVHGAVRGAVEAAEAERHTGMSDAQWWAKQAPVLERVFDPARFPLAARVGEAAGQEHQAAYDPAHAFAFGLERVLDGVEALVSSR